MNNFKYILGGIGVIVAIVIFLNILPDWFLHNTILGFIIGLFSLFGIWCGLNLMVEKEESLLGKPPGPIIRKSSDNYKCPLNRNAFSYPYDEDEWDYLLYNYTAYARILDTIEVCDLEEALDKLPADGDAEELIKQYGRLPSQEELSV